MDCSPPDFSVYGIFPGKDTGKERKVKSLSCVQLFATPWTVAYQAPPSMEFSKQEYRSGLPFPSPEDLPDLGIEPRSPTLQAAALPSEQVNIIMDLDSRGKRDEIYNSVYFHLNCTLGIWRRKWQPTPVLCLENPMDGGA